MKKFTGINVFEHHQEKIAEEEIRDAHLVEKGQKMCTFIKGIPCHGPGGTCEILYCQDTI